jgi:hypothetical protein
LPPMFVERGDRYPHDTSFDRIRRVQGGHSGVRA